MSNVSEATETLNGVIDDVCLASGDGAKAVALFKLAVEAETIAQIERGINGDRSTVYPDFVYAASDAIRHQNEKIPWLPDLIKILGWQGGTVHQALSAVSRLVAADADRKERR